MYLILCIGKLILCTCTSNTYLTVTLHMAKLGEFELTVCNIILQFAYHFTCRQTKKCASKEKKNPIYLYTNSTQMPVKKSVKSLD